MKLCYAKPVGLPYDLPIEAFERYITPRTKAIVINNPHNPRGYVFRREELEHLLRLADNLISGS